MDRKEALPAAAILFGCASALLSVLGLLLLAGLVAGLACAPLILFLRRNRGSSTVDRQLLQLLDESLQRPDGGVLIDALEAANRPSYQFHDQLARAIRRYKLSGDPRAFDPLRAGGTLSFGRFILILLSSLEHGHDLRRPLLQLKGRLLLDDRRGRRVGAQVRNAALVTQLGTVLFFPMFAGISTRVLSFASQTVGSFAVPAVVPALTLYLVSSNVIGFEYLNGRALQLAARAAAASALGLLVFGVAARASGMMLG